MTKTPEICNRCGCEPVDGCVNGSVKAGFASWTGCDLFSRVEREVWEAKTRVSGHHILAWESVHQVFKNGSGRQHFVYERSAELGYTIMRSLPRGKIRAVPTSRLHPKKKAKTTE